MRTFKVLSELLGYPTEELRAAVPDLRHVLDREALLGAPERRALDVLLGEIERLDIYDLEERYVLLFDRTRSLSLHLFEHVHGESRDRGQAMINLKGLYEQRGLAVAAAELPDYLPLFLEFLSTRPLVEAREQLGQTVHILSALAERLRKRRSSYAAPFMALVALSRTRPKAEEVEAVLAEPDPDAEDLAALDAQWESAPVTFGPTADPGAEVHSLRTRMRAAMRPAPGVKMPTARGPRTVFTRSSRP
jgi:nitrate reductase molybdenum cofactor assembly chaperone NarJ/NarW